MSKFDNEHDLRGRVSIAVYEHLFYDCEERGLSLARASEIIAEVVQCIADEESLELCAPESKFEIEHKKTKNALDKAAFTLDALKREFEAFKKAVLRGERPVEPE